jgi:hypothetical protein
MFIPMLPPEVPAINYVMPLTEFTCQNSQNKQYQPHLPCENSCSWTTSRGEVMWGYWDYFLGYARCFRCGVPRGRGVIGEDYMIFDEK